MSKRVSGEVAQQHGEIEAMDHRIRTHEAALKEDRYRDECVPIGASIEPKASPR